MVVAVDFDNTLIKSIKYPSMKYILIENAEDVIRRLNRRGIVFVLNTARSGWYRLPAIFFIKKRKLPIKCNLFNKKPKAKIYIDDSNIFCQEINWLKIEKEIMKIIKEET